MSLLKTVAKTVFNSQLFCVFERNKERVCARAYEYEKREEICISSESISTEMKRAKTFQTRSLNVNQSGRRGAAPRGVGSLRAAREALWAQHSSTLPAERRAHRFRAEAEQSLERAPELAVVERVDNRVEAAVEVADLLIRVEVK